MKIEFFPGSESNGLKDYHFVQQGFPFFLNQKADVFRPYPDKFILMKIFRDIIRGINNKNIFKFRVMLHQRDSFTVGCGQHSVNLCNPFPVFGQSHIKRPVA